MSRALLHAVVPALLVTAACGGVDPQCDLTLGPGEGDAAAIAAALGRLRDGQVLCLGPGDYALDAPLVLEGNRGITIAGAGLDAAAPTVLDFSAMGGTEPALRVSGVPRFAIRDVTIQAPPATGVLIQGSDGARVERLGVQWDPDVRRGGDGLRIEESSEVRVTSTDVLSAGAVGIRLVRVRGSLVEASGAFDGLVGVSLEDSEGCELREVAAEVNVTGILVVDDPSDPARASGNTLRECTVLENAMEHPDRSLPLLGLLPEGAGVVILAADDTELASNSIEGHPAAGVLVLSYETLRDVAGTPAPSDPAYDPHPETIHLHGDAFAENGFDPGGAPGDPIAELVSRAALEALADVVWDGALASGVDETTLCVAPASASAVTFVDLNARAGFATPSTDLAPHACSHPGHGLIDP